MGVGKNCGVLRNETTLLSSFSTLAWAETRTPLFGFLPERGVCLSAVFLCVKTLTKAELQDRT